jgi:acid phosphatase
MGPWIGQEYIGVPETCRVSQVHMISRHGERYPTRHMGSQIAAFANNISSIKGFSDSLEFLNDWTLESDDWLYSPDDQLEQETLTGPAAGSRTLFTFGSEFRERYSNLWSFRSRAGIKVWASDSLRVIQSAKYFSGGFFGVDGDVDVQVIPETAERYGDTLTSTYDSG